MKGNPLKHKTKESAIMTIMAVQDIIATCPNCGGEVGIWSEEAKTLCTFCNHPIFDKEDTLH